MKHAVPLPGTSAQKASVVPEDFFHRKFRMPGEFEPHRGCLLIWPKRPGSWPHHAQAAKRLFSQVAAAIERSEPVYMLTDPALLSEAEAMLPAETILLPIETDDAWARDVGPTFVVSADDAADGAAEKGEHAGESASEQSGQTPAGAAEHAAESAAELDAKRPPKSGGVMPDARTSAADHICGIDWAFNAWGGTYDGLYRHYERDDAAASKICAQLHLPCLNAHPFVMEGGALCSDGEGTLLVTEACLCSPGRNPNLSRAQIEEKLKAYLGAQKIIWLPRGIYGDETNEHVDNICAFVRPGEVVLSWTDEKSDPQEACCQADAAVLARERDAKGRRILVHKLPLPQHPIRVGEEDAAGYVYEEGEAERTVGERLAASYANFYIANGAVLVPQFADPSDEVAVRILSELFPTREVVPIAARDILLGGGGIHCITQPIPL